MLDYLEGQVKSIVLMSFEDHHYFSKHDIGSMRATFEMHERREKGDFDDGKRRNALGTTPRFFVGTSLTNVCIASAGCFSIRRTRKVQRIHSSSFTDFSGVIDSLDN